MIIVIVMVETAAIGANRLQIAVGDINKVHHLSGIIEVNRMVCIMHVNWTFFNDFFLNMIEGIGGGSSSGGGGRSRDKWHGSSSSSSSSWGNRRYDYPNHRDRRHDDRRGGSRSDRDYKDNRDKRGGGADKHGSKREKDNHSSSRSVGFNDHEHRLYVI